MTTAALGQPLIVPHDPFAPPAAGDLAAPVPSARPRGALVNDVIEWIGFACLVVFAWLIWPPAAVGLAGVLLIVVANVRQAGADREPGPSLATKLTAAAAAYREAGAHPRP